MFILIKKISFLTVITFFCIGRSASSDGEVKTSRGSFSSLGVVYDPLAKLYYYGDRSQSQIDFKSVEKRNTPQRINKEGAVFKAAHGVETKKMHFPSPEKRKQRKRATTRGNELRESHDSDGVMGYSSYLGKNRPKAYSAPPGMEADILKVRADLEAQGFMLGARQKSPLPPVFKGSDENLGAENFVHDVPHSHVKDTSVDPYRTIVKLEMDLVDDDGEVIRTYLGTGAMIGPNHVITAAHNLYYYHFKTGPSVVRAYPGRSGNVVPFESEAISYVVHPGYVQEEDREVAKRFDLGLITLEDPIGEKTGYLSYRAFGEPELIRQALRVVGYPAMMHAAGPIIDAPIITRLSGYDLYEMSGQGHRIADSFLYYMINTYGGHSGSPVLKLLPDGQSVVCAVHTYGGSAEEGNYGTLFTPEICAYVGRWQEKFTGDDEDDDEEDISADAAEAVA